MGVFAKVKKKKVFSLLQWLENLPGVYIEERSKHLYIVKCGTWSFSVPINHPEMSGIYINKLRKKLVEERACTEEEFDSHL